MNLPNVILTRFVMALLAAGPVAVSAQSVDDPNEARRELEQKLVAERPIAAMDSVWLEELTWMEVRDALAAGTTTIIIPTGGIEQNGPYLALGKHNYVLEETCESIARKLGDALCAPILKLVPEGNIDEPSGHMRYPGTISMRQETFRAILTDMAMSLETHGFSDIVFIGDSGGNQDGMEMVAEAMNERWQEARAHFVPEYYQSYFEGFDLVKDQFGVEQTIDEGLHDDILITSLMLINDPDTVRYRERLAADKASINGVSIKDLPAVRSMGNAVLQHRVDRTVDAIKLSRTGS